MPFLILPKIMTDFNTFRMESQETLGPNFKNKFRFGKQVKLNLGMELRHTSANLFSIIFLDAAGNRFAYQAFLKVVLKLRNTE